MKGLLDIVSDVLTRNDPTFEIRLHHKVGTMATLAPFSFSDADNLRPCGSASGASSPVNRIDAISKP
jgi:hypothetical protein